MHKMKLTKRNIDSFKPAAARFVVWDTDLSGFGLRIAPSDERVYVLKYRASGRQRWLTIGRHGSPWTPESARKQAIQLLGDVARGLDPAEKKSARRAAITFGELCDVYLAEGVSHKKASTLRSDRGRIDVHLKPLLGHKRVDALERADIERLLSDVIAGKTAVAAGSTRGPGSTAKGGAGVAAQCVALASTILGFAANRRLRQDNPAKGIKKPLVRKMERFLSDAELASLATALKAESERGGSVYAIAGIKLLALTGCRRGEVLSLQWRHVDLDRQILNLPCSKTREKKVFLSPPAVALLRSLPIVDGNPFVLPGTLEGKAVSGIDKAWNRVRAAAGIKDVRMHDLRHTFASYGAASGLGLPIVGKLLGHTQASTTQRYAHLADDPLRRASNLIGQAISSAMEGA